MLSRFLILSCALITHFAAFAAKSEPDYARMSKIIADAYNETMNKLFVHYINTARKDKLASDFFADIRFLPESSPERAELKEIFKNTPAPKVSSISQGIQVNFGNEKFTLTLGKKMGELMLDKKAFAWPDGKTVRAMTEGNSPKEASNSMINMFLPTAEASGWTLLGKALYKGGKWAVVGSAGGAAVGTGAGAAVGCIARGILDRSSNEDAVENCKEGALIGAMIGAGFGSISVAVGTGGAGIWEALDDAKMLNKWGDLVPNADLKDLKYGVKRAFQSIGVLGTILGVSMVGQEVLALNGAEAYCNKSGAGYELYGVYNGVKKKIYFSKDGESISADIREPFNRHPDFERKSVDELQQYLKNKYHMDDEKAALVAKASWAEHKRTANWCAKNPGATYKTAMTNAKNLAEPPGTTQ